MFKTFCYVYEITFIRFLSKKMVISLRVDIKLIDKYAGDFIRVRMFGKG